MKDKNLMRLNKKTLIAMIKQYKRSNDDLWEVIKESDTPIWWLLLPLGIGLIVGLLLKGLV